MPEVKYERDTQILNCLGLDLNRPVDSTKPSKFPYLKNCRSYQAGRIEPRFGLTDIAAVVAGQSPVHSVRRLNDPANSTYTRIVGAGTHLAYGQAAFTDLDSGYSGDPLALVPWKPDASPTPFMYVGDRSRMRKVGVTGSLHTVGLAAPATAPTVALSNSPSYKVVDSFQATAGWGQAGTAGAPALLSAAAALRVNTTIAQILYDSGTTGWACVNPTSAANIGPGTRLIINSGGGTVETITVQSLYPGAAATTIGSIVYDVGTSGLASLVLTTPVDLTACDAIIRNTTVGPENARIIAVTKGPDGNTSIRISTTNTWAATNTVTILATYRAYYTATHAAAETITEDGIRTAITSGTGTLTKTSALDLSLLASGIPTRPSDYMHISMRVSDPTVITELKVLLDVDSTTNDFTRNFYWRSFRASDLTPAASNLQSLLATRQQILQRSIIDTPAVPPELAQYSQNNIPIDYLIQSGQLPPDQAQALQDYQNSVAAAQQDGQQQQSDQLAALDTAISQQLDAGVSQWVELRFRLADLIRVGTDNSRSLANVAVIRITALVTGAVNLDLDSWWIGGGYGPDTGDPTASAYFYRYRARNPATNVPSNFSPATRYQANPLRQSLTITPTQYAAPSGTSLTAADFVLDVERFGGQIADWYYVGTIPNAASPSFTDLYDDDVAGGNPILGNDNYQPWPVLGIPVSGTTGTVAGTTLNDSATNFNTSWAPGTRILVNNQPYTIYRVISTSRLETVENMGNQSAVSWRVDEPTILAQPLPCLWEWDNTFFACGDPINPGRLYYSNPNSETTVPFNYIDMTSPSEPLMNGVQYNIRAYIWSSDNFFQIIKTNDPKNRYRHEQIPNGKGLFSRWAVTREPTPVLCFLSRDGINLAVGGAPTVLTDGDLYPLFPSEGNIGQTVNGIAPPNIVSAQATNLRLHYYDEFLYFDFAQVGGGYATLVLAFDFGAVSRGEAAGGWFWDVYTPNVIMHYGEEGSGVHSLLVGTTDTHLYQYAGNSDNGTAFSMELSTPSRDQSDPRSNKLYGDIMLDADTQGLNATCTPYFNNNASSVAAVIVNTVSRLITAIPLGTAWQTARNISLNIVVSISTSARPKFYIWEPRWTFESAPISALSWEISPSSFGMDNFKSTGLCKITHVSTVDLSLIFTIDGVVQPTITIPNSSGVYKQTIFHVPVYKGKLYKVRLVSTAEFRLDPRDSFIQVKDWGSDGAYQELRVFGDYSLVEG